MVSVTTSSSPVAPELVIDNTWGRAKGKGDGASHLASHISGGMLPSPQFPRGINLLDEVVRNAEIGVH